MIIRGTVDDSGEKQGVFQKTLDGLDEKGREVPSVGERRGKGTGMFEIGVESRRFLEIVQVFKGSGVSRDVLLVGRFQ